MIIEVKLDSNAKLPRKAHTADAGFDLFTPVDITVPAHGSAIIDTGVHMLIPEGWSGHLVSKSGLNVKHNLTGRGLIDAGYEGSIVVKLDNSGDLAYDFATGDKVIQIVILPVPQVDLKVVEAFEPSSDRGCNGFGSTGK